MPDRSLIARTRALLGQARLVYWDDPVLSATLADLMGRVEAPLAVGVRASSDAAAEALAAAIAEAGAGAVRVGGEQSDAVVQLLDAPAGPPAPGFPAEAAVGVLAGGGEPADAPEAVAAPFRRLVALGDAAGLAAALGELAADADALRAAGALAGLRRLLAEHERHGSEKLALEAERLDAFDPERREVAAAARLRGRPVPGLGADATDRALATLAAARRAEPGVRPAQGGRGPWSAELAFWRGAAQDPTLPRDTRGVALTVARACERLLVTDGARSALIADEIP